MLNRRDFGLATLALTTTASPLAALPQLVDPRTPDASQLRAGDFLWPKPPGAWVPYGPLGFDYATTPAGQLWQTDRELWERQRERFLSSVRTEAPETVALRDMTYAQFADRYFLGEGLADPAGFYVGHVALVEIHPVDGPMIIEATPPDVRRVPYEQWRLEHQRDHVFHGRMKGVASEAGATIADRARSQVGKPYEFMNFNLLNERGFYCSKLTWWAVWRATGLALDGDPNPNRALWFSPKQMFYCDTIEHLNSTGGRGTYLPVG